MYAELFSSMYSFLDTSEFFTRKDDDQTGDNSAGNHPCLRKKKRLQLTLFKYNILG